MICPPGRPSSGSILLPVLKPLVFFPKKVLEALETLKVEREKIGTV